MAEKQKRDDLRGLAFGASGQVRKKVVKIDGSEFEVRELTRGQQEKVQQMSFDIVDAEERKFRTNVTAAQNWTVILGTYVPGTNERVFDETDIDSMNEMRAGSSVIAELARHIRQFEAEAISAAKN